MVAAFLGRQVVASITPDPSLRKRYRRFLKTHFMPEISRRLARCGITEIVADIGAYIDKKIKDDPAKGMQYLKSWQQATEKGIP